jgi:uncharacterized protein YacL
MGQQITTIIGAILGAICGTLVKYILDIIISKNDQRSSAKMTWVWILFVLIGLIIGLVVGFFSGRTKQPHSPPPIDFYEVPVDIGANSIIKIAYTANQRSSVRLYGMKIN